MWYIQAQVLTPAGLMEEGAVIVADGRITAVASAHALPPPPTAQVIKAADGVLAPGFIDLQCNGAFGYDFTQHPQTIWQVAAQLPRYGVTGFLPTIITSPAATVAQAQQVLQQRPCAFRGAAPLGLHLEGPFLNPHKKGAHSPRHMRPPTLEAAAGWGPETHIRLVTLAPEQPEALAVIAALAARGVIVSAGHSAATFAAAQAGLAAGVRYGTHLFNAMPPLHHREPGLVGALLAHEAVVIGIIPDGIHVHPALLKFVWQAAAPRLNLVTDAMAALGMPPGEYDLGAFAVTVDEATCRLRDGTLAGSVLSMDTAVRNLITYTGCTLAQAIASVTTIPADLLGLGQRKGRIAPGHDADLVLLTPDLHVAMTMVNGQIVSRGIHVPSP